MMAVAAALRESWEKNWPQVHAALTDGLPDFVLAGRPRELGDRVPVFCYHVVAPHEFEADLAFLERNGYGTIDADALLDHLENRRPAPPRSVVISIDDGAHNLYQVAFPLLARYGMKAVAFIAPAFHREAEDAGSEDRGRPCTWLEIRAMQASGLIQFHSHTLAHRYVPRWPEPIALAGCSSALCEARRGAPLAIAEDLREARLLIEGKLGKPVHGLAFPKYRGTQAVVQLGVAAGYRSFWWGNLPHRGANRPGQSALSIPRLNGDLLRRLPGEGRRSLGSVLRGRLASKGKHLVA